MDLETDKLDVSEKIEVAAEAIAALRQEFDNYLATDVDEAIELIADLRSKLGDKDVKIEELEKRIAELEE